MDLRFRIRYISTKIYWFFANPIRRWYRYFVRPTHGQAIKVVMLYEGEILLTRPNYAHRLWTVPGGAVEKGETYEEAARREITEEVGVDLGALEVLGEYEATVDYKPHTVRVFVSRVVDPSVTIDRIEVAEAAWFSLDRLPSDRAPRVDELMRLLQLRNDTRNNVTGKDARKRVLLPLQTRPEGSGK